VPLFPVTGGGAAIDEPRIGMPVIAAATEIFLPLSIPLDPSA
jgi:hypothetical protein